MVMIRSSDPSKGSSILIEAPDSWRICLILWPPLPIIEPANWKNFQKQAFMVYFKRNHITYILNDLHEFNFVVIYSDF